jgi:hypothetical protein
VPTLGGAPKIIVSPVFNEEGFDLETGQHSKEFFEAVGFHT